jgi:hypothetical protein
VVSSRRANAGLLIVQINRRLRHPHFPPNPRRHLQPGRNFLSLRVWNRREGGWWPDKEKGLTVRLRELADFADGVAKAVELAAKEPRHGT